MRVDETSAGRAIQAWTILDQAGQPVATIQAHCGQTGSVLVNVFNYGPGNPDGADRARCFQSARQGHAWRTREERMQRALAGMSICGRILVEGEDWQVQLERAGFTPLRAI